MHTALVCVGYNIVLFIYLRNSIYLPLYFHFRIASVAMGKPYDCHSSCEVILPDMSKIRGYITTDGAHFINTV